MAAPPVDPAVLFAGRYRLLGRLGRGGNGDVWEAEDTLGYGLCALKLIDPTAADPARVRREVAALRLLRLPGVVRLIDEGSVAGRAFLAMERVEGAPFPGVPVPCSWEELSGPTLALLEILERVHAAGVIHRDLKPANVLVSAEGRPTVLDFGISAGAVLGQGLTVAGQVLGTPAYLAPEQIRGDPVGPQTDLYTVGVMVYQALSGRLPHEAESWQAVLRSRLAQPAALLSHVAPAVPSSVAAAVQALLSSEPDERPRSAGEVAARLSGRLSGAHGSLLLPRLGGPEPVARLVACLGAAQSVDLHGPPGSGRTRCLKEACDSLLSAGRSAVWLVPGVRAFASLAPLTGILDGRRDERLSDIVAHVEERIAAALRAGSVLVADDAERLDRWSSEALERARPLGGVVRALLSPPGVEAPSIALLPLDEEALRPLFSGPDRIFHLPTDAARALFARTGGNPASVDEEVRAWLRSGLARADGDRVAVDREALDRIASGLRLDVRSLPGRAPLPDRAHLAEALRWIAFTAPNATPMLLAEALKEPLFRAEEAIVDLARGGFVEVLPEGRILPKRSVDLGWSLEQRRSAHRVAAALVPPGTEGRLLHLLAGDASSVVVASEASHLAERRAREGSPGAAVAILSEGLVAARQSTGTRSESPEELRLLSLWTEIAVEEASAPALDKVLYEISRSACPSLDLERLEKLVRAALTALTGAGERAISIVDEVSPWDDVALERRRLSVRVLAARRCPLARERQVVAEAADWARKSGDPRALGSMEGWLGRLCYREDRFEESAAHHESAAELEPWVTARVAARLNSASALMEAFQLREAHARAAAARDLAARHRNARYEARAEWLLRACSYRLERSMTPDLELCELSGRAGAVELTAFVCLNEAAVAFRTGDLPLASDLAMRAALVWDDLGKTQVALLARSLACACGKEITAAEIASLARRAASGPLPSLALQTLALLARAAPAGLAAADVESMTTWVESSPPHLRALRMEVLSVDECLAPTGSWVGVR